MSVLYPPVPDSVPKNLTKLPFSYKFKAFLAILGIILFFVCYAAMVAVLGYLVYLAVTYDMLTINRLTILGKIGAIAGSVMLFIFTLKFIFKLKTGLNSKNQSKKNYGSSSTRSVKKQGHQNLKIFIWILMLMLMCNTPIFG